MVVEITTTEVGIQASEDTMTKSAIRRGGDGQDRGVGLQMEIVDLADELRTTISLANAEPSFPAFPCGEPRCFSLFWCHRYMAE